MKKSKNILSFLNKESFIHAIKTDPSLLSLVVTNLIVIVLAVINNWDFSKIIWVYWMQSVFIGLITFFKIFSIKSLDIRNIQNQKIDSFLANIFLSLFFLAHYGFFHYIYRVFLIEEIGFPGWEFIITNSALFFVNHLFSFIYNKNNYQDKVDIAEIFYKPYTRTIPLHLTIILCGLVNMVFIPLGISFLNSILLIIFLFIKTVVDAQLHIWEHQNQQV